MNATTTCLLLACIVPACGIPPATVAALVLLLTRPNPTKDRDHD